MVLDPNAERPGADAPSLDETLEERELGPARRIARYEVESVLSRSGTTAVVRARDPNVSRSVVLKLLDPGRIADPRLPTAEWIALFKREARLVGRLDHPLIPQVHDAGRDGAVYFIAFSLVLGEPLSTLLERGQPLAAAGIREMAIDLAGALDQLHSRGLVHCDIRPSNVIIARDGRPHLLDFSLAHEQGGPEHPLLAANVLTASPEYLSGSGYSPRSDQFALGGMLYQMMVGHRPFEGTGRLELIADIRSRAVRPPVAVVPGADAALSEITMRLLEKDPARRFDRSARIAERLSRDPALPERASPALLAADHDTTPSMVVPPVPPEVLGAPMVALLERASALGDPPDGISAASVARMLARKLVAGSRAELYAPVAVAARELAHRLRISATAEPITSLVPLEVGTLISTVERLLTDPDGAGGIEAPLIAQIAAVVEAYFSATRPREGRKRLSPRRAILELRQEAGRHLRTDVVNALIEHLREVISALDLPASMDLEAVDGRRSDDHSG